MTFIVCHVTMVLWWLKTSSDMVWSQNTRYCENRFHSSEQNAESFFVTEPSACGRASVCFLVLAFQYKTTVGIELRADEIMVHSPGFVQSRTAWRELYSKHGFHVPDSVGSKFIIPTLGRFLKCGTFWPLGHLTRYVQSTCISLCCLNGIWIKEQEGCCWVHQELRKI